MKFKQLSLAGMAVSAMIALTTPASANYMDNFMSDKEGQDACNLANLNWVFSNLYQEKCDTYLEQLEIRERAEERAARDALRPTLYEGERPLYYYGNPYVDQEGYAHSIHSGLSDPAANTVSTYRWWMQNAGLHVPQNITYGDILAMAFERYEYAIGNGLSGTESFRFATGQIGSTTGAERNMPSPNPEMTLPQYFIPLYSYVNALYLNRSCTYSADNVKVCMPASETFKRDYSAYRLSKGSAVTLQSMHYDSMRGNGARIQMAPAGGAAITPQSNGMTRNPGAFTR